MLLWRSYVCTYEYLSLHEKLCGHRSKFKKLLEETREFEFELSILRNHWEIRPIRSWYILLIIKRQQLGFLATISSSIFDCFSTVSISVHSNCLRVFLHYTTVILSRPYNRKDDRFSRFLTAESNPRLRVWSSWTDSSYHACWGFESDLRGQVQGIDGEIFSSVSMAWCANSSSRVQPWWQISSLLQVPNSMRSIKMAFWSHD